MFSAARLQLLCVAEHCVAAPPQDNVDKITFYPGLSGSDLPFGTLTAVKVRSSPVAKRVISASAPSLCRWSVLSAQPEGSGSRSAVRFASMSVAILYISVCMHVQPARTRQMH